MANINNKMNCLDITRNVKRPPARSTIAFVAGWRACEAGDHVNPYAASPCIQPVEWTEWHQGHGTRGERGFDYSHRIGSGTTIGPFVFY